MDLKEIEEKLKSGEFFNKPNNKDDGFRRKNQSGKILIYFFLDFVFHFIIQSRARIFFLLEFFAYVSNFGRISAIKTIQFNSLFYIDWLLHKKFGSKMNVQ